jgi:hypothetical protein
MRPAKPAFREDGEAENKPILTADNRPQSSSNRDSSSSSVFLFLLLASGAQKRKRTRQQRKAADRQTGIDLGP